MTTSLRFGAEPERGNNHPQDRVDQNGNDNDLQQTDGTILSTSHVSPAASLGPTVTDSIKDLASQMQLISNTIGNALISSPPPSSATNSTDQCQTCKETSVTLGELQSQVQVAMNRVEKMNLTLTLLQTNTNLVMQSLEKLSAQVVENNVTQTISVNCNRISPVTDGPMMTVQEGCKQQSLEPTVQSTTAAIAPQHPNPMMSHNANNTACAPSVGGQQHNIKGQKQKVVNNGIHLQQSTKQEQPSKSFRELMMERRNGSQKPATTMEMKSNAISDNTVHQIDNLEDLIMSCASYLTGSPTEYATWLREGLDVNTIADLARAVTECPGMLVAGNGSVGMWNKQKFCDAVLAANGNNSSAVVDK